MGDVVPFRRRLEMTAAQQAFVDEKLDRIAGIVPSSVLYVFAEIARGSASRLYRVGIQEKDDGPGFAVNVTPAVHIGLYADREEAVAVAHRFASLWNAEVRDWTNATPDDAA